MQWLADTHWVDGCTVQSMSPLDYPYAKDYIQEIWLQILSVPQDKMMEIWYHGKASFVSYIKTLIKRNVFSDSSNLYNHVRKPGKRDVFLDSCQWNDLMTEGTAEVDELSVIGGRKNVSFGVDRANIQAMYDLVE